MFGQLLFMSVKREVDMNKYSISHFCQRLHVSLILISPAGKWVNLAVPSKYGRYLHVFGFLEAECIFYNLSSDYHHQIYMLEIDLNNNQIKIIKFQLT